MSDTMYVYVINQNGHPLMPCRPSKARKLLRDRRAKVIRRCPFTIQLLWNCEEHVQKVTLSFDKGRRHTGFSCGGNGNILLSGEIEHRGDVKNKMDDRRTNRKLRRGRLSGLSTGESRTKPSPSTGLSVA